MRALVHVKELAVGGDDLGREQVVDGQAVVADQIADPASQGEAADADRPGVAEAGG
jgi:endonuclease YncB( thermonuclease family)